MRCKNLTFGKGIAVSLEQNKNNFLLGLAQAVWDPGECSEGNCVKIEE
jgi:hypothetical protein